MKEKTIKSIYPCTEDYGYNTNQGKTWNILTEGKENRKPLF